MLLEIINDLLLAHNHEQAKKEILADAEYAAITGKPCELSGLQTSLLLETVIEQELGCF